MEHKGKTPTEGKSVRASGLSTFVGADAKQYSPDPQLSEEQRHQQICYWADDLLQRWKNKRGPMVPVGISVAAGLMKSQSAALLHDNGGNDE